MIIVNDLIHEILQLWFDYCAAQRVDFRRRVFLDAFIHLLRKMYKKRCQKEMSKRDVKRIGKKCKEKCQRHVQEHTFGLAPALFNSVTRKDMFRLHFDSEIGSRCIGSLRTFP